MPCINRCRDGVLLNRIVAFCICSLFIACFSAHSAKGENTMILKPVIEQNGTSIEGVLYTPDGEGPFPTVILTHGFTGNYPTAISGLREEK